MFARGKDRPLGAHYHQPLNACPYIPVDLKGTTSEENPTLSASENEIMEYMCHGYDLLQH